MDRNEEVFFFVTFDSTERTVSLHYPVFYPNLLKEIRTTFSLVSSARLIVHYEYQPGVFRPLEGGDDLEILVNFQFHHNTAFVIKLKISIDQTLPPLDVSTRVRNQSLIGVKRNSGFFILEEHCDDPILAPRLRKAETGDPLLVYNSSFFVEEPSDDERSRDGCLHESWSLAELIGQGGFGKVYVAIAPNGNERLAVKVVEIDQDAEDETLHILNEIETLQSLSHSNIIQYVSCGRDTTQIFVFMELMEGGSISSYLKRAGKIEEPKIQRLTKQILAGLCYLHSNGVIHRDIKGSNLLLDKQHEIVKLGDFGAAKKLSTLNYSRYANAKATMVGTPYWMAPEVIKGEGTGRRSDVWSVGCTLVEMLTGHPPYRQFDPIQALFKIASTKPSIHNFNLQFISSDLQNLMTKIFVEVEERPLVASLLRHKWLR